MRSLWFSVFVCAMMLVACNDDDSGFSTQPSGGASSSVCEDCDDGSSSSAKSSSSSAESSSSSQIDCKTETEDNCEYGELVDNRDGQTYKTVKIGDQWWMAENLNYETEKSYCYVNKAEYCETYGRLYSWATAVGKLDSECGYGSICALPSGNIQGVCPSGWHLPDSTELAILFSVVGGEKQVNLKLKSTFGWNSSGDGMDAFGFSALAAGFRNEFGYYYNEGEFTIFWSSTENNSSNAYAMHLHYYGSADRLNYDKENGYSVRCIQD